MLGGSWLSRRLIEVPLLAVLEALSLLVIAVSLPAPAHAQWWGDGPPRPPGLIRRAPTPPPDGGGFFENLFGGGNDRGWRREPPPRYRPRPEPLPRHVDYSHAPPPSKVAKPEPGVPVNSIVVMGDGMADWLAYGLEDAFSDTPNVQIVRKAKQYSGLIHYQAHSDLDWWHVARDILAKEKPNYVVMMLGLHDRQNISERDIAQETEKQQAEKAAAGGKTGGGKDAAGQETPKQDAAKTQPKNGVLEFRSDQWAKVYSHRIDETIAALKSKGVPVFWVGLPSIRGTKSTADALYLDDLYRARAERDGAVYIDVWDGFVDDSGKYTSYGPDYEGQTRRLRTPDGVFFTKYGARKLAHYVEREIRRYMNNRAVVALPANPVAPVRGNGSPAERPLAGPVVPLTSVSGSGDTLLGGAGTPPVRNDPTATNVLLKGDALQALPGRADDHAWPPSSAVYGQPPKTGANKVAPAKTSANATIKPVTTSTAATVTTPASAPHVAAPARTSIATEKKVAPELPRPEAAIGAPVAAVAKPPVEAPRSLQSNAVEARKPMPLRHERRKQSERREASRSEPLRRRVQHRPRVAQEPSPAPSNDGGLFGRDGLFGWMR